MWLVSLCVRGSTGVVVWLVSLCVRGSTGVVVCLVLVHTRGSTGEVVWLVSLCVLYSYIFEGEREFPKLLCGLCRCESHRHALMVIVILISSPST